MEARVMKHHHARLATAIVVRLATHATVTDYALVALSAMYSFTLVDSSHRFELILV